MVEEVVVEKADGRVRQERGFLSGLWGVETEEWVLRKVQWQWKADGIRRWWLLLPQEREDVGCESFERTAECFLCHQRVLPEWKVTDSSRGGD